MIDKGINVKKIDLSGVSFPTSDASTCALIYTAVRNTYGFPLYLTNFKINEEKRDSVLVSPIILTDSVVINLGDYYLTISATAITATAGVINVGGAVSTPILTSPNDEIKAQKPVVEVMSGYSFNRGSDIPSSLTIEFNYVGAVKNGNKLTLVIAVDITKNSEDTIGDITLCSINMPSSILNRLYPSRIGTGKYLDIKYLKLWASENSSIDITCYIVKSNTNVYYVAKLDSLNNTQAGVKRNLRYESTFLLSDNLAE